MAAPLRTNFKNGKWIKNWKFDTSKSPFDSKMNTSGIAKTMLKIEKFAKKTLQSSAAWKAANLGPMRKLDLTPKWRTTIDLKKKKILLSLSISILDPTQPPQTIIVAPPPPKAAPTAKSTTLK